MKATRSAAGRTRTQPSGAARGAATAVLLWAAGCTQPMAPKLPLSSIHPSEPAAPDARFISDDPAGYLRDTLRRCTELEVYEVDFWRQEQRRTLLGDGLSDEEHMRVKYKDEPLSIRMDFSEPSTFSSVAYVEGQNGNMLRCKWRKALIPGARPPINDYDPQSAVKFGFSRSPVTDFGVRRLLELIVDALDRTTAEGLAPQVTYRGVGKFEKDGLPVHHIELLYHPDTGLERLKVDLLVHVDSELPAGCYLWQADGQLDAKYLYAHYDLQPQWSAESFEIQ
jgi:hypothetical protein